MTLVKRSLVKKNQINSILRVKLYSHVMINSINLRQTDASAMHTQNLSKILFILIINLVCLVKADESEVVPVTVENFPRVAFDLQSISVIEHANGINNGQINKLPILPDTQPSTFVNRDMLYLLAVIDIKNGAQISVPVINDRYISFSIINRDGYTSKVFYGGGVHMLNKDEIGTDFAHVIGRIMVDPDTPQDILEVNSLQSNIRIFSGSERIFPMVEYNQNTYEKLSGIFSELMLHASSSSNMFGQKEDINDLQFLIGTSIGWGGLSNKEAIYYIEKPNLPIDRYKLTVRDPPVQGFWSITVYNADGFFQKGTYGKISVNSRNAIRNSDGSITVNFGGCFDGVINCLELMRDWSYVVRIYRPQEILLSGDWTFPIPKIR